MFSSDPTQRSLARRLYQSVANLPIISPHGHTDAQWFSLNAHFSDPVRLLITPDHYVLRMFYSQGLSLEEFGVAPTHGAEAAAVSRATQHEPREIWRRFAANFHLFHATPSQFWLNHVFYEIFGIDSHFELSVQTADLFFDQISDCLAKDTFTPRALYDRFKIEVLATTDAATDSLEHHRAISENWPKRIIPTYRPDSVIDPEHENFKNELARLSDLTGEDTTTWSGYLNAHRKRRAFFKSMGATATDHGHASPQTLALSEREAEQLFHRVTPSRASESFNFSDDAESFRAHMLWRMAEMSTDDGLVMQIHPGSYRNHNPTLMQHFGRDRGADIPIATEYTRNLKPMLDSFGNSPKFQCIVFTLDETTYTRELAPIAGHYPAVKLGAPWWFHDSPEGMMRFRKQTTETAGFYNLAGFVDDTRAFLSIPARHDLARRIDARVLAEWVLEHRITESTAFELMQELAMKLAKKAYRL
jgi:glucuronate isomerase